MIKHGGMSDYLSNKITIMSFVCIIIVLYIHASYDPSETPAVTLFAEKCISGIFGRLAVPMFFCISGFLFFQKIDDIKSVFYKIKKRVRSLLIPFVIAAIVFPLFFFIVEHIPGTARLQSESLFSGFEATPLSIIQNLFFGNEGFFVGHPWAFHLWYLRDLILAVFITPVAYLAYKKKFLSFFSIVLLLLGDIIGFRPLRSLFFFYVGPSLLDFCNRMNGNKVLYIFLLFPFLFLSIADVFSESFGTSYYWVDIVIAVLGLCVLWMTYDLIPTIHKHKTLPTYMKYTFFIYLYHAPAITIVHKLFVLLLGANVIGFTTGYILTPPSSI